MVKYIVKRVLMALLCILIVTIITFFVMNLVPGGPFNSEKATSAQAVAVLNERYNLDKPVWQQYLLYMKNMLHGDFGVSLKTGRDISATIWSSFSYSARLGGMAALAAIVCGLVLGSTAALTRGRWPDRIIVFFTTLCTAMPSFVLATLLLLVFCVKLGWVPVYDASHVNYVLPVISLALYPTAYITRLTKTSMLDSLNQDYVRTAKAKGVPGRRVIFKHALRNALVPVITYVGPMVASIICGSLVVETVFNIGGLGSKFIIGITNRDYPMIMATTIFLSVLMVTASLITDLVYKLADPRIELD